MSDQSKAERRAEIKPWLFNVEDENGDTHYLAEDEFIGTYDEACSHPGDAVDTQRVGV